MADAFGATPWQQWRTVLLPGSMPALATSARIGLARAIEGMVVVELVMVAVGVGRLLLDYQGRFDAAAAYAVVVAVIAEAVLVTYAGRALERRLAPWQFALESPA
jgi:ABC-type nitrate/sulfonate/bicarbonate transport system permease component